MRKRKKSRSVLEKELDNAWSGYVRTRDRCCQKCGGNGSLSAHHAFGRRHRSTRWDVMNGVALDYACHIHWAHRDPAGFAVWFRDHVGVCQFERLAEAHNIPVKHTTEQLQQMLEFFKGGE